MKGPLGYFPLTALLLVAGFAGAQQQTPGANTPHIAVDAPAFGAYVGSTIPLSVRTLSPRTDSVRSPVRVTWESSEPTKAWVTDDGKVVMLRPGKVTITARFGSASAQRTLDVRESGAKSIAIEADRFVLRPGERTLLRVAATDRSGRVIADARPNVGIVANDASIDAKGYFTAARPGTYVVVAELGGVSTTRQIDVVAEGALQQGTPMIEKLSIAEPRSKLYTGSTVGLRLDNGPISAAAWSVSDTNVAQISHTGTLTLRRPGKVTIWAVAAGKRAERKLTVLANPVADMALRVDEDVRVGEQVHVKVDAWARGGLPVTDAPVNYAVTSVAGDESNASISRDGTFVAREPGAYTIIADVGGKADRQTVLVRDR